jgi:bifunctional non-homologous end joining protein LigD
MPLEEYQKKRDFNKTTEPSPEVPSQKNPSPIFVIQEHHARNLHWDFRLEHDGVLASWALPKGIPLELNEKHLAVQVEDHPFDYKDFEGVIPKGQYGAGTVTIWDKGTYQPIKWDDKVVEILADGQKLKGRYSLVRTGFGNRDNSWLIIKNAPKKS